MWISRSARVMIRPEHCVLNPAEACRWKWAGKVVSVTFLGADLLADVECDNGLSLRVRTRTAWGVRPGDGVVVGVSEAHLWPIPETDPPEVSGAANAPPPTSPPA